MGGNEGDDGPGNQADRLLNFFPGAQAIGADDIDLRFGFVGLAAFNNLRKAGARDAAEVAPGHDHEVRVASLFSIHRRPELSDHLLNRDTAAAGAGFRRKRLVFNVGASDARLNVFPHGVMRTDGITVACVGIREDRDLHGQDNFPGVVHHVAHTGPGVGPAQLMRRGIAPGHVEGVIAQRFRHLRTNGIDPAC